jgi:NAD(P)-dependent dehydrogenase (short-subunit alcohol dehydrogenase family)
VPAVPAADDLVALVVGATTEAGAAAVADLARPGACLGLAGAEAEELAPLVLAAHDAGARATLLPGDLAVPGMPARVVDAVRNAYGRLDLLVLAVDDPALDPVVDPLAVDPARFRHALDRTAWVPFLVLREAGRVLAASGRGRVVLLERTDAPVSIGGLVRASGLEVAVAQQWRPHLGGR